MTFYECINTIYQFIKSFFDNKMSNFEDYGAFQGYNKYALLQIIGTCSSHIFLISPQKKHI